MQTLRFTVQGSNQANLQARAIAVANSYFGDSNYSISFGEVNLVETLGDGPLRFQVDVTVTETL